MAEMSGNLQENGVDDIDDIMMEFSHNNNLDIDNLPFYDINNEVFQCSPEIASVSPIQLRKQDYDLKSSLNFHAIASNECSKIKIQQHSNTIAFESNEERTREMNRQSARRSRAKRKKESSDMKSKNERLKFENLKLNKECSVLEKSLTTLYAMMIQYDLGKGMLLGRESNEARTGLSFTNNDNMTKLGDVLPSLVDQAKNTTRLASDFPQQTQQTDWGHYPFLNNYQENYQDLTPYSNSMEFNEDFFRNVLEEESSNIMSSIPEQRIIESSDYPSEDVIHVCQEICQGMRNFHLQTSIDESDAWSVKQKYDESYKEARALFQ